VAVRQRGLRILVVHGKGEGKNLEIFERGLANLPNVFILPEDDLLFILEASKRFSLFVCNDSGLMHLAALAAPVLALFGPSDPRQWGPLGSGSRHAGAKVLRKKDRLCDSITPGEVLGEIRRRIRSFR
jgi:ADP-heptose:LPS heptosyltransferase